MKTEQRTFPFWALERIVIIDGKVILFNTSIILVSPHLTRLGKCGKPLVYPIYATPVLRRDGLYNIYKYLPAGNKCYLVYFRNQIGFGFDFDSTRHQSVNINTIQYQWLTERILQVRYKF